VTTLAFLDIDNTLVFSRRALAAAGWSADDPRLVAVERVRGMPVGFMTARAREQLWRLARLGLRLVPITTRTMPQYLRLDLFADVAEFAIVANGARLLVAGTDETGWPLRCNRDVERASAPLADVQQQVRAGLTSEERERFTSRDDEFLRVIVSDLERASSLADAFEEDLGAVGWTAKADATRLYLLPSWLNKRAAAQMLAARLGKAEYLAAGDSPLDLGLLSSATAAITPRGGAIAASLRAGDARSSDGLASGAPSVTLNDGPLAAEEILEWVCMSDSQLSSTVEAER